MNLNEIPDLEDDGKPGRAKPDKTKYTAAVTKKHYELIDWIAQKGYGEYDESKRKLNTNAFALAEAKEALGLKGDYATLATGKGLPAERNCYCHPVENGAWAVYRHGEAGKNCTEAKNWFRSKGGFTTCFLNRSAKKVENPVQEIVEMAREKWKFFHFRDDAFVEVVDDGHPENVLIDSAKFRRKLRLAFTERTRAVAQNEWLKNAIDDLQAYAFEECDEYPVFNRLAKHGSTVYLDLVDEDRTVIEIDAEGWRLCKAPPVRFRRSSTMLPLPMPVKGGTMEDLKKFVNIEPEDLILFLGVLVGFLNIDGPFPLLLLIGGDGRGKTILARLILMLLDPTTVEGCSPPGKIEDLMLSAKTRRILFYDNLGDVPEWLSNALCRVATGAAQERRTLYADQDITTFFAKCPVILTSIRDIVEKADLGSRTIRMDMPRVEKRLTENYSSRSSTPPVPRSSAGSSTDLSRP